MEALRRLLHKEIKPDLPAGGVFLIVGLGNPGREYKGNRHNVGFMVIDRLCADLEIPVSRFQSKALVGVGNYEGRRVVLVKPQTYMNLSGQAVSQLLRFYKVLPECLLVIHDDLDFPFGALRLRPEGGAGGQKGLASIIQSLGTRQFARLRVGIGRPPGRMDPANYVLHDFSNNEQAELAYILEQASKAAQSFMIEGLDTAMNRFNGVHTGSN